MADGALFLASRLEEIAHDEHVSQCSWFPYKREVPDATACCCRYPLGSSPRCALAARQPRHQLRRRLPSPCTRLPPLAAGSWPHRAPRAAAAQRTARSGRRSWTCGGSSHRRSSRRCSSSRSRDSSSSRSSRSHRSSSPGRRCSGIHGRSLRLNRRRRRQSSRRRQGLRQQLCTR